MKEYPVKKDTDRKGGIPINQKNLNFTDAEYMQRKQPDTRDFIKIFPYQLF